MSALSLRPSTRRNRSMIENLESRVLFVRVEGLDVSLYQGVIDWNQVAASGKQFVFMRASRTNLDKDSTFETNLAGAQAAGLLVGTYHYTLPNNLNDAGPLVDPVLDARRFFNAAGKAWTTGFLPPVIDAEAGGAALGKTAYSNWINAFSDEIFALSGVRPIVYANINYTVNYIDQGVAAKHKLWLARYNGGNDPTSVDPQTSQPDLASFHPNPYGSWNVPYGGPRSDDSWRFWQYTSRGDGPSFGVSSTYLDLDLYNGSLDELKKEFQIGYQKNFGTAGNNPIPIMPEVANAIEAENYDIGGQDVSYSDTTADANIGSVYRASRREGVDVSEITLGSGKYRIFSTAPTEYVEYTINVQQAGNYQLDFFLSQTADGGMMHAEIDGNALSPVSVPNTGSASKFIPVSQNTPLTAGTHVLRIAFDTTASNGSVGDLDKIQLTQIPVAQKNFGTPGNTPFAVGPGITTTIQAEDYDIGGPGLSYEDNTFNLNTGEVYRTGTREGVDLAATPEGSDTFRITSAEPGEYVEYTINVSSAGSYQFDYRVSQTEVGGLMHGEVDGVAMPILQVPDTEDLNNFASVTQAQTLTAGQHVLRLSFDTAAANGDVADVDKIIITQAPAVAPPAQAPIGSPVPDGAAYVRGGRLIGPQNFAFSPQLLVQRGKKADSTAFTILSFNLSNVSSISSARLRLVGRLSDNALSSMQTNIYNAARSKRTFSEGAVTYKTRPGTKKLLGSITVSGTSDSAYEFDLTSFLQAEFAAGRKNVTLVLKNFTKSVTTQTVFASDESGTPPAIVLS